MNAHSRGIWIAGILTAVLLMTVVILGRAGWWNSAPGTQLLGLETPSPTPFPPEPTIDITPYPTSAVPFDQIPETRGPGVPPPTPQASDPYHVHVDGYYAAMTSSKATQATAIVSGTVTILGSARWTTLGGTRPANPFSIANHDTIFTPVTVQVARYLKGDPGTDSVQLMAFEGTVGQDSVDTEDDLNTFHVGDKVIIFLDQQVPSQLQPLNGQTLWGVFEHYTLDANGSAYNSYRTLPLQKLLGEMNLGN